MEPIPETVEALRELTRHGDTTIARSLLELSRAVERIVPDVVGLSLSFIEENLTFTMTATAGGVAELDAMQYLDGGPCDDALRSGEATVYRADDPADEERWRAFARATAVAGVASTLSLPIIHDDVVVAGVNLYASTPHAFDGHHDELAKVCGATAGAATTNADLDFTTRFEAAHTPDRIRADRLVDQATGALMSFLALDLDQAEDRLRAAATRAGISDAQMAQAIIELLATGD